MSHEAKGLRQRQQSDDYATYFSPRDRSEHSASKIHTVGNNNQLIEGQCVRKFATCDA